MSKLVFIGFMGAGKSTAARSAGDVLDVDAIDVDRELEQRFSKSITRLFADYGEDAFRKAEEELTLELLAAGGQQAIALGGGAVISGRVREALSDHLVIWLDADVDTAWRRVHGGRDRPLARSEEGFARLHAEREPLYESLADVIVPCERSREMRPILEAAVDMPPALQLLWACSQSHDYPVYIGPGALRFWPGQLQGRRFLVTDGNVGRLYGDALEPLSGRISIMPGEQSKTVAHAEIVWTELAREGVTREDIVIALGGGVVGDLAGFCAATYQRGVRYVQAPTSLVAQVDSAYGGKTGVDLAEAKNYVGAYHQPSAVLADPETLRTLPEEELAAGYAEVVKTALIAGGELWERVRSGADPAEARVITACVRTKLRVVAQDERDEGFRQVLNLGHTVGHAIETATGYARYRHGEAVALGLLAALRLSGQDQLREEIRELLARRGLPVSLDGTDPDAVVMATARDKKRRGEGEVPFVLLDAPGRPQPGCIVQARDLIAAVRELSAQ